MVAQSFYDIRRFIAQDILKMLVLRIDRTTHGKILPDHNAVFVAKAVKFVAFVDVSAPTARDVASDVVKKIEGGVKTAFIARMERVERHPVRAHGKNALAVDDKAKIAVSVFVGRVGAGERDGADARTYLVGVDRFSLVIEGHLHVVKRRLTVIARPPKLCV